MAVSIRHRCPSKSRYPLRVRAIRELQSICRTIQASGHWRHFSDPADACCRVGLEARSSSAFDNPSTANETPRARRRTVASRADKALGADAQSGRVVAERGDARGVSAGRDARAPSSKRSAPPTALAALSQFFPLKTATEVFAQGAPLEKTEPQGRLHPDHLRARRSSWRDPMGFYKKQGLNVESGQDRRLGGDPRQDHQQGIRRRAHAVADADRDLARPRLDTRCPTPMPAIENINGQAITLAIKHKDKRDPKDWKGFKLAVPFDYSMHNYLLRYYLAEHGIDPDTDVQIRAVPPPEMVANLRADNIDGFLGPDPMNQRAVYRRRGLHPHPVEGHLGRPSVLRLRGVEGVRHRDRRTPMPRCSRPIIDATAFAPEGGEPQADRRGHRARELSQSAGHGAGAGADRHLRRRPRQRAARCPTASISIRSRGSPSRSGS